MSKNKNKQEKPIIYNTANAIELLDSLTPVSSRGTPWALDLVVAMNPELGVSISKPRAPKAPPQSPFENSKFKDELRDSLNHDGGTGDITNTLAQLDQTGYRVFETQKEYELAKEDYACKIEEYNKFEERREHIKAASSKFIKGYTGYGVTLEFYAKSTYLRHVIDSLSWQLSKYISTSPKDEDILITNFKKIMPRALEMYLLFGKASLNFSKIVPDEIVVEDPTQIVNVNMLMFLSGNQVGDMATYYEDKRRLGWKDWDPVYYVDILRLPYLQEDMKLNNADEIQSEYPKYYANNLSYRYDLKWTIPIVGDRIVAKERMLLLGGDASLLMNNLYLFGTIETANNVLRTHIPLSIILHYKDTSLGAGTLLENSSGYTNDVLQESLGGAASEGDFPVIFTTTNDEVRMNEIPMKDLPAVRLDLIRELFSKHDVLTPEQVSSLKDVKRTGTVIEYHIDNVLKPLFSKYLKTLVAKGRIDEKKAKQFEAAGIVDNYPRVDLRNKEDFSGYLEIFNAVSNLKDLKIKPDSFKKMFKELTELDLEFEEIKQEEPKQPLNNGGQNGKKRNSN